MSRRCCCGGCVICTDDFNRANSSNIYPFREQSGNWSTNNGTLVESGNNGAYAYCPVPHPFITPSCIAYVDILDVQVGDRPILFINHTPGTTPSEYVKCYFNTGGKVAIQLVSGGYENTWSPGGNYSVGTDYTLRICSSVTGMYGGITSISKNLWMCPDNRPIGRYAGVGNHGTNQLKFDNFGYEEHYATDTDCQKCYCECGNVCLPYWMLLTISSNHPERDGATVELEYEESADPNWQWYGEAWIWDCDEPTGTGTGTSSSSLEWFRLYCPGEVPACGTKFGLEGSLFAAGCSTSNWGPGIECDVTHNCDPLEIIFGPFTCGFSPPPPPIGSCTDTLTITAL